MGAKKNKKRNKKAMNANDGGIDSGAAKQDDAMNTDVSNESASLAEGGAESVDGSDSIDVTEQLRREVAELKDKFLRSKAEQQNIARRNSKQMADVLRYSDSDLLKSIIEVMDDLDRALEAVAEANADDTLTGGVRLVRDKLQKILVSHQVEVIDASNAVFDPTLHEALLQQPSADHEPGQVVSQVQKGYKLHDRVLRPAKVIVAAALAQDSAEPSDHADAGS